MRHNWYEYSIHDVVYRSNDNGPYELWADSTHLNPCTEARYKFQANSTLTFTNACFAIPIDYNGTWNIDDNNQLSALVSDLNNGQLYYFGLVGIITEMTIRTLTSAAQGTMRGGFARGRRPVFLSKIQS